MIKKGDIDSLMDQSRSVGDSAEGIAKVIPTVPKCGYCYRLLYDDDMVSGLCLADGCEKLVCTICESSGIRYCAKHLPSRDDRIKSAVQRYESGDLPLLVTSERARLLEINFLNRIQARFSHMESLIHPLSGELITVKDWDALLVKEDERADVMRLLNKAVLDTDTMRRVPLNASLFYEIKKSFRQKGSPVEILVQILSRLPVMIHDGFDTKMMNSDDLTPWLLRISTDIEGKKVFRFIILGSTTGWDESARLMIQGDKVGSAFIHRQVIFYLFDLISGELIFNNNDELARSYRELFAPLLPSEEIQEVIQAIENLMLKQTSITLQEAIEIFPYSDKTIEQAFIELADGGKYEQIEVPKLGWALIQKL